MQYEVTCSNKVDYVVCYDEFKYATVSRIKKRRVIVKAEKPSNQMIYLLTFIVTPKITDLLILICSMIFGNKIMVLFIPN